MDDRLLFLSADIELYMNILKIYTHSFRGLSPESWMLAVVMLINRSGSMVLPFLGIYMTDYLGFKIETAGLVLSCFGIGSVVGSWLGGMITDKIGEFKVQFLSLFLSVPLFCLMPFFKTEISLAIIMFLQSSVTECFRPANSVAITKYAKKGNITRSFSLNRMAVNLGFSIGPAMGGILSAISYDFLFFFNAAGALISGIVYVRFFRKRQSVDRKIIKKVNLVKERSPYLDMKFLFFSFLCLLFAVCFFQLLSTLTIFYKVEAGLSQQAIGYILGFSGIFIVILEMLLVNFAEKRMGLGFTLFLGTIFCGAGYAMLGIWSTIPMLILSISLMSIGEIWVLPFTSTVTAIRSGENNKGAYMGTLGIGFAISFIITPFLGTHIAETYGFRMLWFGTGVLLVLTAIGYYLIVPSMLKEQQEIQKP